MHTQTVHAEATRQPDRHTDGQRDKQMDRQTYNETTIAIRGTMTNVAVNKLVQPSQCAYDFY